MKIISKEKIENVWGGWRLPDGVSLSRVKKIAQAQLEACEKEHKAVIKEIRETIRDTFVEPCILLYVMEKQNKEFAMSVWEQTERGLKQEYGMEVSNGRE